ncbi:MAG TPA: hypothetical protein VMV93_06730 [Chloroflexota bacterium]|nr:hypothetical protein [Chloroflexota bacterium]
MWQGLALYFALVGLHVLLNYGGLRTYLLLPLLAPTEEEPPTWPGVTVVVMAAGQSAALMTSHLKSLLASSTAPRQLIVAGELDAQAAAAATEFGASVSPTWPPPIHIQTEWLLFTTPDTLHQATALKLALGTALRGGLDALALLPRAHCLSFWDRLVVPFAEQQYFAAAPGDRLNRPHARAALATPCYFLVRQAALHGLPSSAPPATLEAATALAEQLKASGGAVRFMRGDFQVSVQRARTWRQLRRTARPLIGLGLGRRLLLGLSLLLSWLAVPCAIYGLATHSLPFELAALLTYAIGSAELLTWQFLCQAPLAYSFLTPISTLAFALLLLPSRLPGASSQT